MSAGFSALVEVICLSLKWVLFAITYILWFLFFLWVYVCGVVPFYSQLVAFMLCLDWQEQLPHHLMSSVEWIFWHLHWCNCCSVSVKIWLLPTTGEYEGLEFDYFWRLMKCLLLTSRLILLCFAVKILG
jgi:hypothetical protein